MWGEILSSKEVYFCTDLLEQLRSADWARPLLTRVGDPEIWSYDSKPVLFELRFAGDAHTAGLAPTYEYTTGVGASTVDFRIDVAGTRWLVELVSILTSDALKQASWEGGLFFGASLQTNAEDPRQSVEGETLLVQQKIGEKVVGPEGPRKFPAPVANQYHVILVDMRGFGITGGDIWDFQQVAYGLAGLPADKRYLAHYWTDSEGNRRPILGLFDEHNTHQRAARRIRDCIHFIGFCNDESYALNGVRNNTHFFPNPRLFQGDEEVRLAYKTYPLMAESKS